MFQQQWENEYFFIENADGNAQCLICSYIVCRNTAFFLKRHYDICHNILKFLSGEPRNLTLLQYKAEYFLKFIANNSTENNVQNMELSFIMASYEVASALAKQGRPFEDCQLFLNMSSAVWKCFGEKGEEILKTLSNIPLSRRTITRRTEDISKFIYYETKNRIKNCKYFSISLDESTDLNSVCQLIICIKTVDKDLNTFEEVLDVVALHSNVTGELLYDVLVSKVFSIADKNKLAGVCTDGAKVMVGLKKGLVGYLLKNNITVPTFHCIIHQQALFAKNDYLKETMDLSIKIINKIKGGQIKFTTTAQTQINFKFSYNS